MSTYIRTGIRAIVLITLCVCAAASGFTVTLYQNDCGTAAQQADLISTGLSVTWDSLDLSWDRDGDDLAKRARRVGYGTSTLIRQYIAPFGKVINYPQFSCYAAGFPTNWGTGVSVYVSRDGMVWEHRTDLTTEGWTGEQISSTTSGDSNYASLKSVWIRIDVYDTGGWDPAEYLQSKAWDFTLTGTLIDTQPAYLNDFGTSAQRSEVTIIGGSPSWDALDSSWDTDGDNLAQRARRVGYGTTTIKKHVRCPEGQAISNPTFYCYAIGYPVNWNTGVTTYLSVDGTTWEHASSLSVETPTGVQIASSSAGDPKYVGLSSIWVRADISDWGGWDPPEGIQAKAWDFQVTGEPSIYQNDFGSATQREELGVSGGSPAWDAIALWDRDGDGLAYRARRTSYGTTTVTREIRAPHGQVVSYPSFSCFAIGYPFNWNTGVTLYLSVDGTTWEHGMSLTTETGTGLQITSTSALDPKYRGLTKFWIRADIMDWGGNNPPEGLQAKAWDFEVNGTVVDGLDYSKHGLYGWTSCPGSVAYDKIPAGSPRSAYYPGMISLPIIYPFDSYFQWDLNTCIAYTNQIMSALHPSVTRVCLGEENNTGYGSTTILNGLYDYIKANHPGVEVYQWFDLNGQYAPQLSYKADGWVMDPYTYQSGAQFRRSLMKHLVTGKPVASCMMWVSPESGGYDGDYTQDQLAVCSEFNISPSFFAVQWPAGSVYGWLADSDPEIVVWRDWLYGSSYDYLTDPCAIGGVAADAEDSDASLPAASANNSTGSGIIVTQAGAGAFTDAFSTLDFMDKAHIGGFLNLRWDYVNGKLTTEPKPGKPHITNESSLIYVLQTNPTRTLSQITGNITGQIRGSGTQVKVDLSLDGTTWQSLQSQSGTAGTTSNFNLTSNGGAMQWSTFYIRVRCTVPTSGDAWVVLDNLQVNYTAQ